MPSATLPPDRCTLATFLSRTGMAKNTFFLRYRHAPEYAVLLDPQYDRRLRVLHVRASAVPQIAAERAHKAGHGNKGRAPRRVCAACAGVAHPRHRECPHCGTPFPQRAVRERRVVADAGQHAPSLPGQSSDLPG